MPRPWLFRCAVLCPTGKPGRLSEERRTGSIKVDFPAQGREPGRPVDFLPTGRVDRRLSSSGSRPSGSGKGWQRSRKRGGKQGGRRLTDLGPCMAGQAKVEGRGGKALDGLDALHGRFVNTGRLKVEERRAQPFVGWHGSHSDEEFAT